MDKEIGFKTTLETTFDHLGNDGLKWYSLKSDLVFYNGKDNIIVRGVWNGETFLTNMASTPKWLHWLIPPDKKLYKRASVLHDWLYSHRDVSRRYADKMFLLAIRSEMRDILVNVGNPRTKWLRQIRYTFIAYSFWLAVRLLGKSFRV